MIEGVDFAWGGSPAMAPALVAAGMKFAWRYAVSDLSPFGRGITAAEYQAYRAAGIDVGLYWEGHESWMLGGYDAGVGAARNAVANIAEAGMPAGIPVYFAHDIEPDGAHFAAVDACLAGAAAVIGPERVGLYGGYDVIAHAHDAGTARWLCQTYAWSRGLLHPAVHLYQYDNYGNVIGGIDVDFVRAYQANYGQASMFGAQPEPEPAPGPVYATPEVPAWFARSVKQPRPADADVDGVRWHVLRRNVQAIAKTYRYSRPDTKSPYAGPPVNVRDRVTVERWFELTKPGKDGKPKKEAWFVAPDGSFLYAGRFTPRVAIRTR